MWALQIVAIASTNKHRIKWYFGCFCFYRHVRFQI